MKMNTTQPGPRAQLPRQLMALPERDVVEAIARLAVNYRVEDITLPQSGLGLLQLRDGAFHEAYFPGEIPLATAHVMLSAHDGRHAEGAAQIMHDSVAFARAISIADAIVGNGLPEKTEVDALLQRGEALLKAQASACKKMLASTKVDFSLLGSTEEEDTDD